jgi:hypothetical protein
MLDTCTLAVLAEVNSSLAISRLLPPAVAVAAAQRGLGGPQQPAASR